MTLEGSSSTLGIDNTFGLSETNQLLDTLRKDKEEIEKQASELEDKPISLNFPGLTT